MTIKFPQLITKLFTGKPGRFIDADGETRFLQYTVFLTAGLLTSLLFGLYHLLYGNIAITLTIVGLSVGLIVGWLLLYNGFFTRLVYRVNSFIFFAFLFYLMILGGNDNSMILWMYIYPLVVFYLLGKKEGTRWCIFMFACFFIFFFGPFDIQASKGYSGFFIVRFHIIMLIICLVTFFYERFRTQYRIALENKNQKLSSEIKIREDAERSLTDRELRYEAIYLGSIEGILLVDNYGDIVECNPQILTMLGYKEDELIGRNVSSLVHTDDFKVVPSQLGKLHSGETIQVERRLQTVSGVYLMCEESGKKLKDNLIILLYSDITERKIAEMALERANQALDRLAHIDGLTHVANRRRFDKVLETEWLRMYREKKPLSLILADVDYFKQYNDMYGHQAGDDCLVRIAAKLTSVIHRPGDLVARYGGEEFVIVLPDTDEVGCLKIAKAMNAIVEEMKIEHADSSVGVYVTISLGVSTIIPEKTDNWSDLIGLADRALYRAKDEGRNRVC